MPCLNCNKETDNSKFCSRSCATIFNNKNPNRRRMLPQGSCKLCKARIPKDRVYCKTCWSKQPKGPKKQLKYCPNCNKQISRKNKYCSQKCGIEYRFKQQVKLVEDRGFIYENRTHTTAPFAKKYLKYKYGNKCSICNLNSTWNDKPLTLILDHIDGHSGNWSLKNIRLVCPNCDSQLPTYKSKNKGNGRPRK